jgi:hypothetical protein
MFGNAIFVIPVPNFTDNSVASGALFNMTENMTLAYHYNLASAGAKNLRNALAGLADPDELSSAERKLSRADEGTPEWHHTRNVVARLSQGERLAALDIKPFPDLFWGMKMGNTSLGVRLAVAMDGDSDAASVVEKPVMDEKGVAAIGEETKVAEEIATSASALDLSLGATMYKTPVGDLDLGLSVGMQSFSGDDPNSGIEIGSTGGMDIAFNARLNKPIGKEKHYTLIPLLSANIGSLPSAEYDEESAPNVTEVSYTKGDLGVGFRKKVKEKGMVLAGILGGYGATTYKPTITIEEEPAEEGGEFTIEEKEVLETTDTSLGATVLAGCEFPIAKWLHVRGGVNAKFSAITDEVVVQEKSESFLGGEEEIVEDVVGTRKLTGVSYYYNMGLRTIFNGLVVDVLLARNIVHRGPYFLTGASGNWATHVCVVYKF